MNIINIFFILIHVRMILMFNDTTEQVMNVLGVSDCKFTQLGTEYSGSVAFTAGGIPCQNWLSDKPLHKVDSRIKDEDFPEKSISLAKNYCRNPTKDSRGPWCYTLDPSLIDDNCAIRLCNYGECRVTGTGAEYGGKIKTSASGRKCKLWNKRYKIANGKTTKFARHQFSDSSRTNAHNFCRNPDDSIGGPWCYVENETFELVEKEYCDIPFCDDKDCLVYTKIDNVYPILTKFSEGISNVTFWIKLWNPIDEQRGEVRILLSLLPIPTYAEKIAQQWHAGVEILLSNKGSGIVYPHKNDQYFETTQQILKSSKWSSVWITWFNGFISVGTDDSPRPIITAEYKIKNTISSLFPNNFFYYGLMGTGVLWSTQLCQKSCETHITFGMEFMRMWPFYQKNGTNDIQFHVRAGHDVAVRLFTKPSIEFPCFTIIIGAADTMSLIYQDSKTSTRQYFKTVSAKNLLNFWAWKEFTVSIFGPHLRVYSRKIYGDEEMMYVYNEKFSTLRWFSIGSKEGIGLWTLFCSSDDAVEDPWPPNCITDTTDYGYKGSQWTSAAEIPCLPWIAEEVPDKEQVNGYFIEGSVIKAFNKCRNPLKDPTGPYCYAISQNDYYFTTVAKYHCPVRICQSSECRMAGTANDYVGTLSVTRSGRICAPWFTTQITENKTIVTTNMVEQNESTTTNSTIEVKRDILFNSENPLHAVNKFYLNNSLYPEGNVENASNYCRNPSRNIGGTWCYTTDPVVPQDLCNVRDCEKPDECIFYIRGGDEKRRLYVLPEYRSEGFSFSLKAWEPDNPDYITFTFLADDGLKSKYILKIGDDNNEKITLYYQSEREELQIVKRKTLSHLLYLGKWSNFVIRVPRGKLQLFYEGAPKPLFEWEHPVPSKAFLPIYYSYSSNKGFAVGVSFDCSSRCHIENTSSNKFTRVLPITIWSKQEIMKPDKLELMVRAKGIVSIPFFLFPTTLEYYGLTLDGINKWVYFFLSRDSRIFIHDKQIAPGALFTASTWTNINIRWINNTITVRRNDTVIFSYEHDVPLLFYYFSLSVDDAGWATWTANCIPPDIDGSPIDGGWSGWGPWACSASCNGGTGIRKRFCNSPVPNVRGEPCLGPSIMTGRCNTIICGDITEDTVNLIKRNIKTNYTSITVTEGQAVTILPDFETVAAIFTESTKSKISWIHNGIYVQRTQRIRLDNNIINIQRAFSNDSGVYTLSLQRVDMSHLIIKVVSLAVIPKTQIRVIRTILPMSVTCNCVDLGYVYSDLSISWVVNDKVWKDYGITLPIVINTDYIPQINTTHKGLWKCIVKQKDLGFQWTTNVILVKVLGPPSWRTYLMEDKLTKPIFGWMPNETFVAVFAIILFLLISCCVLSGAILYFRHKEYIKQYNANRGEEFDLLDDNNELSRTVKHNRAEINVLSTDEVKNNLSINTSNNDKYQISRRGTIDKGQQVDFASLNTLNKRVSRKQKWKNRIINRYKTKFHKKQLGEIEDERRKLIAETDVED